MPRWKPVFMRLPEGNVLSSISSHTITFTYELMILGKGINQLKLYVKVDKTLNKETKQNRLKSY